MASCAHWRAFFGFCRRPGAEARCSRRGEDRDQVVRLEDEAHLPRPKARPPPVGHALYGLAVDVDLAVGEVVEAGEDVQQRGLPRPGRAHDGDHLPRLTPRSTPWSASTRSPPAAYTFWTPVASIMKSAAVSSTKPPRSVETDSRGPSTTLSCVAYTLRSNHRLVAPDAHRTGSKPSRSTDGWPRRTRRVAGEGWGERRLLGN